jgi:hypothetical protein
VQNRVFRSLKLWSMYADLEESLGTFQSTKAVYQRILDLHIATPQVIMNYAIFLEEHNYFEEAFKVLTVLYHSSYYTCISCLNFIQAYERGVAMFRWPHVFDLWNTYLTKFISRYVSDSVLIVCSLPNQSVWCVYRVVRNWKGYEICLNSVCLIVHRSLLNLCICSMLKWKRSMG